MNEGLGRREFRSQVQISAAGMVGTTKSIPSDKTRATHGERIGSKQESTGVKTQERARTQNRMRNRKHGEELPQSGSGPRGELA